MPGVWCTCAGEVGSWPDCGHLAGPTRGWKSHTGRPERKRFVFPTRSMGTARAGASALAGQPLAQHVATATDPNKVDAIKLSLMLADLRLPTINQLWKSFAKRADAEGWTAARFLAALAEHELAERDRRRIERHLREARLLP